MKLLSISIILSIVCIFQVAYSQSGDENLQMGTWKLNETESIRGKPTAYIQVFDPAGGDQVKVTMDGIDRDGKPFHNEWVGKFDGKDYPLTGKARYTRSYKKIDDRTLEVTNKTDGKITFHTRHVVSADGKSRTLTPIEAQESQSRLVYHKQIDESGKRSLSVANATQSNVISQAPPAPVPVPPRSAPESGIHVLQATYGAGETQVDVTEKIQSLVQSGQTNVRVGNHLFGKDPIFGKVKTLSVDYLIDAVQYHTDIGEGGQLSFSQPNLAQPDVASQNQATQTEAAASPLAPTTATTTVPSEDLAPGTALWLIQRLSVTTKTGVIGILPGSRVTVSKDNGFTITVSDGTHTFEAPRARLTVDPVAAERAAAADYASQVAGVKTREQSQSKLTDEKNKYWAEAQSATDQWHKIGALENRYKALQQQESRLLQQIGEAEEPLTTIYGRTIRNPARSDVPSLRNSLNQVRDAKKEIKKQMEDAQRSN